MKKLIASFLICTACFAIEPGTPTPTPSPSPAQEISQPRPQWLIALSTDATQPPGAHPATTYLISRNRPFFKQMPDGSYMITFEP